jgi:hypothetical protein
MQRLQAMFNKDGFEKIGEDIYVYHNFVTEEECDSILDIAKSLTEEEWVGRFNTTGEGHKTSNRSIDHLIPIKKRLSDKLEEGIYLAENISIVRMRKGATWGLHSDNHDFLDLIAASKLYTEGQEYTLEKNNIWGLVMYFNDFDGGRLFYPNQGIEYQPKRGDLVIHSSEEHCLHGVDELKSDVRYSHSNNLFNYIKVPKGI